MGDQEPVPCHKYQSIKKNVYVIMKQEPYFFKYMYISNSYSLYFENIRNDDRIGLLILRAC